MSGLPMPQIPPPHPSQFYSQQEYLLAYQIWQRDEIQRQRSKNISTAVVALVMIFVMLPLLAGAILAAAGVLSM